MIGVAYKKNVEDTRESPSFVLIEELEKRDVGGRSTPQGMYDRRDRRTPPSISIFYGATASSTCSR